jgi:hypothetical protein
MSVKCEDFGVVRALFRFLYCGICAIPPEFALDGLELADLYQIEIAKNVCISLILSYFDFDDLSNVLLLISYGLKFNAER